MVRYSILLVVSMLYVMLNGSMQIDEIVQTLSTSKTCRELCRAVGDPTVHYNYMKEDRTCRRVSTNVSISKEGKTNRKSSLIPNTDQTEKKSKRRMVTARSVSASRGYRRIQAGKDLLYVKRFNNKKTWEEALRICRSENGSLVIIDTQEKSEQIKAKLCEFADTWKSFYMWIGLRDFKNNNVFEWVDRSQITFDDWFQGEPNNVMRGAKGTTIQEDCAALVSHVLHGLHWNDMHCGRHNGFICEKKLK